MTAQLKSPARGSSSRVLLPGATGRRHRQLPSPARSRVSVVIPCYNYGHFLEECVQSVLSQAGVDADVLVVDDGSPDGSGAVAEELATRRERVRVICHARNAGHIATYNEGLAQATGEYVLLLSADDALAPGALARAVAVMQRHPDVGLVYGFSPSFTDTPPPQRRGSAGYRLWNGRDWLNAVGERAKNPVVTPSAVLRTQVMRELGGYDPRFGHSADLLLWLRVAARWDVAHVHGMDQAYYRSHGSNMHTTTYDGGLTDLTIREETWRAFFDADALAASWAPTLRARVTRALATDASRLARTRLLDGADPEEVDGLRRFAARHGHVRTPKASSGITRAVWAAELDAGRRLGWWYWRSMGVHLR